MRITDAEFKCDRCGGDCGNGGVSACTVVSAMHPTEPGQVINFHFCLDKEVDGKTVKGCTSKVLTAKNLEYYRSTLEGE